MAGEWTVDDQRGEIEREGSDLVVSIFLVGRGIAPAAFEGAGSAELLAEVRGRWAGLPAAEALRRALDDYRAGERQLQHIGGQPDEEAQRALTALWEGYVAALGPAREALAGVVPGAADRCAEAAHREAAGCRARLSELMSVELTRLARACAAGGWLWAADAALLLTMADHAVLPVVFPPSWLAGADPSDGQMPGPAVIVGT